MNRRIESYRASLAETPGPVNLRDRPQVKIDLGGLMAYAGERNVQPTDPPDDDSAPHGVIDSPIPAYQPMTTVTIMTVSAPRPRLVRFGVPSEFRVRACRGRARHEVERPVGTWRFPRAHGFSKGFAAR